MKRFWLGGIAVALILAITGFQLSGLNRIFIPSGTGITAKQMCSMVFVSRLDADYARAVYVDPLIGGAASLITLDIDTDRQQVSAAIGGLFWGQRAVYREGLGCTLVHGDADFDRDLALPPARDFQPMMVDADHRATFFNSEAVSEAINNAFDDPEADIRNTLGIAILHRGRLIGERYAHGASRESPFLGWSMSKSTTATLAGALIEDGLIGLHDEGRVPALLANDRPDITLDHLLRMTAGLVITEHNDGTDANSQMLFTRGDMAAFAASRPHYAEPGEDWEYMSGQTNLAMSALQPLLGASLPEQVAGLRAQIFEPLDIYSAIIEPDEAGLMLGSSYMYATAQDWARLAQLYLDGGMAGEERIFGADWTEIVTEVTPGSQDPYGLGFWMPADGANMPESMYFMNGFQSQLAIIVPEHELVIVRFGATNNVGAGTFDLTRAIIAAMRQETR